MADTEGHNPTDTGAESRAQTPEERVAELRENAGEIAEMIANRLIPAVDPPRPGSEPRKPLAYPIHTVCELLNDAGALLSLIHEGEVTQGQSRIMQNLLTALNLAEQSKLGNHSEAMEAFCNALGILDTRLTIDGYNIATERELRRTFGGRQ